METEMKVGLKTGMDKPMNRLIYGASIASILLSLFACRRNPSVATFTGLWAPTILGLGIFMKETKALELQRRQLGTT